MIWVGFLGDTTLKSFLIFDSFLDSFNIMAWGAKYIHYGFYKILSAALRAYFNLHAWNAPELGAEEVGLGGKKEPYFSV